MPNHDDGPLKEIHLENPTGHPEVDAVRFVDYLCMGMCLPFLLQDLVDEVHVAHCLLFYGVGFVPYNNIVFKKAFSGKLIDFFRERERVVSSSSICQPAIWRVRRR